MIADRFRSSLAVLALSLGTSSVTAGTVLYVDDDAPPAGDGASWETAFRFLQDAFTAAAPGAAIHAAAGVYRPDLAESDPGGTGDRTRSFELRNGVVLRGGYRGLDTLAGEDPDHRDVATFKTLLSGDLLGNDETGFAAIDDNSLHVISAIGTGATSVVDGVTVAGGNADGPDFEGRGGGVFIEGGAPVFRNTTLHGNRAVLNSGGVFSTDASPTFFDCTFDHNIVDPDTEPAAFWGAGGGALLRDGSPTLVRCRFVRNIAASLGGGAALANCVAARVDGCVFSANDVIGPSIGNVTGGGGLSMSVSEVEVIDCSFLGNTADGGDSGGAGGGIAVSQDTWIVRDCLFAGNLATTVGGAVFNQGAGGRYENCLFLDNVVLAAAEGTGFSMGGAMHSQSADPTLIGCHFEGNNAARLGGAVSNAVSSEPTIEACSFAFNAAGLTGGGMMSDADSLPMLSASAFCHNVPEDISGPFEDLGDNTLCPPCEADVDGDGNVGFPDLLAVLDAWGPCPGCPEDIDEDDSVGFTDLLSVMASWGPCDRAAEPARAWNASATNDDPRTFLLIAHPPAERR